MKHSKIIGLSFAMLFAAPWAFPLFRAASFLLWSRDYFHETSSINASTDLHYSSWLLGSYSISLLGAFAISWLFSRRPRLLLLVPGAGLGYSAAEVLWLRPEAPIHLLTSMNPWRPLYISAVAVVIAAAFCWFPRYDRNARTLNQLSEVNLR